MSKETDLFYGKSIHEINLGAIAPLAEKVPHVIEKHGDSRTDPFFWLNDRNSSQVLSYLAAENQHTEKVLSPTQDLQSQLFAEMKKRIIEDDSTVPQKDQDFFYYYRYESGKEYPILCRKMFDLNQREEILLDTNEIAKEYSYFCLGEVAISSDHQKLAYAIDVSGRRIHTLFIKDLSINQVLPDKIEEVPGNMAWANDNQTLFYTRQDAETLRAHQIYRHKLGETEDALVFEELDPTYRVSLFKSSSKEYLIASSSSTITSEASLLGADRPDEPFQIFCPRKRGHEYSVDHAGDRFYILTNDHAKNFKLMEALGADDLQEQWREVIPHREDTLIEGFHSFKNHVAIEERFSGLPQIRIFNRSTRQTRTLSFKDPVYQVHLFGNREYETEWIRVRYESLTEPDSTIDYHLDRDEHVFKKQREVPGYSSDLYESTRLFARTSDGTQIPISLVKRKDTPTDPSTPCLIYGYGSYGISIDPTFSIAWVSLMDRGFILAIAHVRGGSEMGRHWYEEGRQLRKKNTFSDFIACSEYLIKSKRTSASHLYAMGGSAGGLLMGAIMNMRPDLYRGVVANVPFVDVLTTMLDDSIPLTTGEYDEWGNPNDPEYYRYIKSYSPYDNLIDQAYPHLLVTTGLHDSQVQYWEPAKWVAKLRTLSRHPRLVLLWTDMEAGHGGKAGRFNRLHEVARIYAFLIALETKSLN